MPINLTQHTTRCSNNPSYARERLITSHLTVEEESKLVQISLEFGASFVIGSKLEWFQNIDCLVQPVQILGFFLDG